MATKSRKRHAPITDTDSDESLTASQSQSKSSVPKKPYVPRFLIIHSEVEGKDISLPSPFLIEKAIMNDFSSFSFSDRKSNHEYSRGALEHQKLTIW